MKTPVERHEWNQKLFDAVILSAQSALNSAMLINGGAVVAVLALLGQLLSQSPPAMEALSAAHMVTPFTLGVLAAAIGFGAMYLSQWEYARTWVEGYEGRGDTWRFVAIYAVVASYVAFATGAIVSAIVLSAKGPIDAIWWVEGFGLLVAIALPSWVKNSVGNASAKTP